MSEKFFSQKENVKRALILGGGGARGAFEVGVWKALNELGYQPDIVTGTSVGALNGALFLQGKVQEAEKMWKQIESENILEYDFPLSINSFQKYQRTIGGFIIEAVRQNGLSSKPLKNLIDGYLTDEETIREQKTKFGLSVTNYDTKSLEYYFLSEIPNGKLNDFLLASSSLYPAMKKTYIDGVPYVDGGYRNYMPIEMAMNEKAEELIIVDVQGSGFLKKDYQFDYEKILWISTKWPLGDLLFFHQGRSEVNIQLGYYETMKLASKYPGYWYTFDTEKLEDEYQYFYVTLNEVLDGKRAQVLSQFLKKDRNQLYFLDACIDKWEKEIDEKNLPLALMELAGRTFRILPDALQEVNNFQEKILYHVKQFQENDAYGAPEELRPDFPLSGKEWAERLKEKMPFISNRRMILYLLDLIQDPAVDISNKRYHALFQLRPYPFVIALYILYLKEKKGF